MYLIKLLYILKQIMI